MKESLKKFEAENETLGEITKNQKEKTKLNFNDRRRLERFIKRQKQQDEILKSFNKKITEGLKDENNRDEMDTFKEELLERLKDNKEMLEKDEKTLNELEKIAEKINKEQLSQKLEQLAKQNKNKKRSLDQLLELTKRFYITQKLDKLKEALSILARKQKQLSEEKEINNTKKRQDELNKEFEDILRELNKLKEENEGLRKPMNIHDDRKRENLIKEEQKGASQLLDRELKLKEQKHENTDKSRARQKQKKAAQEIKRMAEQMYRMMMTRGEDQLSEDVDMLRQILDNLVLFSFGQEDLMNVFKTVKRNHNKYARSLVDQHNLKIHFEHIDDSLFALSLRNPKISEKINSEIEDVFFYLEKSLTELAENRTFQGVAAQQYSITAANTLASYLSDLLDNLEMQMSMNPGSGGGDMQLPDIIMSQEQLNEKMKESLKKDKGPLGGKRDNDNRVDEKKGEGYQEELSGELLEIYKKQQLLRKALEEKIGRKSNSKLGNRLIKEMEDIELDLINKGFTHKALERMTMLRHQLLKLENAIFQQGEDIKRESKTNVVQFKNTLNKLERVKKYFNTTEILNRHTLPLQPTYKRRVQEYFNEKND